MGGVCELGCHISRMRGMVVVVMAPRVRIWKEAAEIKHYIESRVSGKVFGAKRLGGEGGAALWLERR